MDIQIKSLFPVETTTQGFEVWKSLIVANTFLSIRNKATEAGYDGFMNPHLNELLDKKGVVYHIESFWKICNSYSANIV